MEMANEVEAFFEKIPKADLASIDREIPKSIEKIKTSHDWLQRDVKSVQAWLEANISN